MEESTESIPKETSSEQVTETIEAKNEEEEENQLKLLLLEKKSKYAYDLLYDGKYSDAVDIYSEVLQTAETLYNEHDLKRAELYYNYGHCCYVFAKEQIILLGNTIKHKLTEEATENPAEILKEINEVVESGDDNLDVVEDLQAAWEVLEVARYLFESNKEIDETEAKLKIAQIFFWLGDVGCESDQIDQGVEDFKQCINLRETLLDIKTDRKLADTYYALGETFGFLRNPSESLKYLSLASSIMEARIENGIPSGHLEKYKMVPTDDKTDTEFLKEIKEKIEDFESEIDAPKIDPKLLPEAEVEETDSLAAPSLEQTTPVVVLTPKPKSKRKIDQISGSDDNQTVKKQKVEPEETKSEILKEKQNSITPQQSISVGN